MGSVAAVLAITLVLVALAPGRLTAPVLELAAGVALLVATLGFQLEDRSEDGFHLESGYGSTVGFTGAALLAVLALLGLRPPAFDRNRALARLAPIAACVTYLVVVVLPWWDVLPRHLQSALRFAPISWLMIAGALLAIWLLGLWARQITSASKSVGWLALLPLALLALAALYVSVMTGSPGAAGPSCSFVSSSHCSGA